MRGSYTVLDHAAIGIFFWLLIGKIAVHFGMPKEGIWMMVPIIGLWPLIVPLIAIGCALFGIIELIF